MPGRDLAANLIGFTGQDLIGLDGLEASYDDVLRGVDGERVYEIGQGELDRDPIPGGYHREKPARPGSSLELTIDRDLQYEVQRILGETMREREGRASARPWCSTCAPARCWPRRATRRTTRRTRRRTPGGPGRQRHRLCGRPRLGAQGVRLRRRAGGGRRSRRTRPITVGPAIRKGDAAFRDTHPSARARG